MHSNNNHSSCKMDNKVRINNPHCPFLSSLLIALLPKCSFCTLAYTSAITMCSAKSLSGYSPGWASYISIAFTIITVSIVSWNYKGRKTTFAVLLSLTGIYFIIQGELHSGSLNSYYWGGTLVFLGVWINGNLFYFVKLLVSTQGNQVLQHG